MPRDMGLCLFLTLVGCSGDLATPGAPSQLSVPPRSAFPPVADAIQLHCGTLDCHGQIGRNMRLFGQYGLRLNSTDDPLGQPTSDAEYEASYASVVGLEPEAMSKVVQQQALPNTLAMIRKPLGIEKHKGNQLMVDGDPLDRCMIGWLVGTPDENACTTVSQAQRPFPPTVLDAGE